MPTVLSAAGVPAFFDDRDPVEDRDYAPEAALVVYCRFPCRT